MWTRIRAFIVEDEPLAAEYLAALLDETCQVEVVGSATESESGLRLCAELRPDAVFLDQSTGPGWRFSCGAIGDASTTAMAGLHDRKFRPRHGRLQARCGGLPFEALGSETSR
jgi:DNA-binding NarL/FixJ family response regulator